jgi:ADP-heptose:LPS heptosyltransferase
MQKKTKIIAIQFKYLGDAVFITPALQALHQKYTNAEIHILVAAEVAPVFEHLPFIKKVWALPRTRGKAKIIKSLPFVRALRQEKFDLSIDLVGNDRGGILSLLVGAKSRLSAIESSPTFLQKLAYTRTIADYLLPTSWVKRHLKMLSLLMGTSKTTATQMLIVANPLLASQAKQLLQDHPIICHLGTSQQKKEWPIARWVEFYQLATKAGYKMAFSAGTNERERNLVTVLKKAVPEAFELPPVNDLAVYLSVLNQAKLVISGDTGPLHFAAGLGVKVIGLFGTADSVLHAAPIYKDNELNYLVSEGIINLAKITKNNTTSSDVIFSDSVNVNFNNGENIIFSEQAIDIDGI